MRGEIKIFRDVGNDFRKIIKVDYNDIMESGNDIALKDKDIVIVPDSAMKKFLYGVLRSVRVVIETGDVDVGAGFF